jgi:hypothetical protein
MKNDYQKGGAEVDDWNPLLIFQIFDKNDLKVGLVNIKNLIISPIKRYQSSEEMMRDIQYWKNIPLNEDVVLRLDKRTPSVIIAEVQFTDGNSALYAGAFNTDAHQSKSEASKTFSRDRASDKNLVIKESPLPQDFHNNLESSFWDAAQNVMCTVSKASGFNNCNS